MKSSILASLVALCFSVPASAQVILQHEGQEVDPNTQQPQQQQPMQQQPVQQQPVQQAPQPFADQPQAQPAQQVNQQQEEQRLVRQVSGYLSVPFMLTDGALFGSDVSGTNREATAGFGIHGRFGWEFGFLVLEASVGWMIMAVDAPEDINLQDIWVGLGGRFQFLNRSRMVPFVSAAFRMNFFTTAFSGTGTSASGSYEFEPGAQVALGLAIELSRNFGLEAAVSGNFVFATGNTFDEFQMFLQPWIGATLYI